MTKANIKALSVQYLVDEELVEAPETLPTEQILTGEKVLKLKQMNLTSMKRKNCPAKAKRTRISRKGFSITVKNKRT